MGRGGERRSDLGPTRGSAPSSGSLKVPLSFLLPAEAVEVFVSVGWALEAWLWLWVSDLSPLITPSTKVSLFCVCLRRGVRPESQLCRQCSESHVQKLDFELQGCNNAAVELKMEQRSVRRFSMHWSCLFLNYPALFSKTKSVNFRSS